MAEATWSISRQGQATPIPPLALALSEYTTPPWRATGPKAGENRPKTILGDRRKIKAQLIWLISRRREVYSRIHSESLGASRHRLPCLKLPSGEKPLGLFSPPAAMERAAAGESSGPWVPPLRVSHPASSFRSAARTGGSLPFLATDARGTAADLGSDGAACRSIPFEDGIAAMGLEEGGPSMLD